MKSLLREFDEQAQKAIVVAESLSFDFGHQNVGSEHLLLSLLKIHDNQLKRLLQKYDVNDAVVEEDIKRLFGTNDDQPFYMEYSQSVKRILERSIEYAKDKNQDQVTLNILIISLLKEKESVAYEILQKYHVDVEEVIYLLQEKSAFETPLDQIPTLVNINKKVKTKKYKIIGRENEIDQVCTILSKKEKNNVLIIGEAGVGKSALVEKLAMMINQGKVVDSLKNKIIYELSLSSLVAGTKYRGEFEEKFKKIIDKVKDLDNVIIFIDEIHNVIGAGGAEGAIDASNILKPYLARKDMTVIGATTIDEYYKHFEKDHAMNRRFSIVTLKENTKEETLEILKGIKGYYESYHQIKIDNVLLKELIELVDCHIKNRTYPDKAIDILDLSCVKAKFYHEKELTKNRIVETIEKYLNITIHHQMDYQKLEKQLNKDILGQEKGIHQMIETFQHKQLPISFFIYGPTSCGKTLTAKSLAKYLNYHYLKLDMNQYQESHSLYKLLETYHEKPSLLLSTLQSYPHTVLLLDHIDQACEEIIHLFSQIFDDGYYEDQAKRKISFENVVFIMSQTCTSRCCMGFKKSRQTKYLKHELFDKVDQIIEYQPLSKEIVEKIIHLREHISIEKIHNLLKEEHVPINLSKMMKQIKQMS
ncbi:ATP-dependent Clp protease ATP-binding subunit [Coprobacillus sp. AF13-15]|nr:ATP-dependent Clp protease ATP-binding subunit [Coprobacillus sp. AF13-4LB]RHS16248.1 ATP-dependent Clp protease ATP-binding subunit [Coprobacillus sp. AF13-15]RHS19081.1 ATP-dependent Clp protease ATP-binding subunit [Coprobacillus sp. AF13-25]